MGLIKSAMGIGGLLMEGIGDALRVSLTDDPEKEVQAGYDILRQPDISLQGRKLSAVPPADGSTLLLLRSPMRWNGAFAAVKQLKVAVMGCVVNGPGEAKEADIGIAGGKTGDAVCQRQADSNASGRYCRTALCGN